MPTRFSLIPEKPGVPDLQPDRFKALLPASMSLDTQGDPWIVVVDAEEDEDQDPQYLLERELNRLFFYTRVRLRAAIHTRPVGTHLVSAEQTICWSVQVHIPDTVAQQNWTHDQAQQLRLWSEAQQTADIFNKMLLLFQIIELTHPTWPRNHSAYPAYNHPDQAPSPLTECKLLRNLITHAGNVGDPQLRHYCRYLGLPELMLDRTDSDYIKLIEGKLPLVEREAQRILSSSLECSS